MTTHNKPPCQLSGEDGNVYSIIGRVKRALIKDGQHERADEFHRRVLNSDSYEDVLTLCEEYVDVA